MGQRYPVWDLSAPDDPDPTRPVRGMLAARGVEDWEVAEIAAERALDATLAEAHDRLLALVLAEPISRPHAVADRSFAGPEPRAEKACMTSPPRDSSEND